MGSEALTNHRSTVRPAAFAAGVSGEEAWIEVISKMDSVYADLVESQTQLERQNAALEEAQRFIANVIGAMTDVLIACECDGTIQEINHALTETDG